MSDEATSLEHRVAALEALLDAAKPPAPALVAQSLQLAEALRRATRGELMLSLLQTLVRAAPRAPEAWRALGFAYGAEQRLPEALDALRRAAGLAPHDPAIAAAHAQAALDAGVPASALFEQALRLAPDSLPLRLKRSAALLAEHQAEVAISLLADALRIHPDWAAGHKLLSSLRFSAGERPFDASYRAACAVRPQDLALRLDWFAALAQVNEWSAARQVILEGEQAMGARPAFLAARAMLASESGDSRLAEELFAELGDASSRDEGLGIAHIRHCLRTSRPERAEPIALALLARGSSPGVWPYLSLIWRLTGDARAAWLDGAPPYIRSFELGYSGEELAALAALLRRLLAGQGSYAEQSVRGGAQTPADRQLFFRAEPEIRQVRERVSAAVRDYIEGMPPFVAGHPLLGVPRNRVQFSGSWAVRLLQDGFHVSHTHPRGWISSALYVSVPDPAQRGPVPAGWIRFGAAPAALGLDLPHYQQIEPKPGQLVLFPSTMWHQTLPFAHGERLVIAFDVMRFSAPAT